MQFKRVSERKGKRDAEMILLWNILIIIGIILLCILGIILLLTGLVLFVPVRYRLKAERKAGNEEAMRADVKVTWLLHLISASFRCPEQAYLKVNVLGIPVFSTEDESSDTFPSKDDKEKNISERKSHVQTVQLPQKTEQSADEQCNGQADRKNDNQQFSEKNLEKKLEEEIEEPSVFKFFQKLWEKLKNIKYTILQIYDKIKRVIKNLRYYLEIIRSDCFQNAFSVCKAEAFSLLKSIFPRKIAGNFTIGTGDPAGTARVLAIHGMLYPLIGNHISITPDFDNSIMEGDFFLKGKLTIFKVLKTAIKIYFNKDLRKVIRLLKREAA